jgi:hypothetical protein
MSHAPAPTGSLSVSEAADEEALAADRKNVSLSLTEYWTELMLDV